jgi:hypothetical protein
VRTLKELSRSYLAITSDLARVMTRLKAVYRSWAIPCASHFGSLKPSLRFGRKSLFIGPSI